ncbi:unnamed protein product, partial [Meganyctiphanes norvegica]
TICLMFIGATTARSSYNEGNRIQELLEPACRPLELLVELLPIIRQEAYHKLSTTHAIVRRCFGVNNEHKACVPKIGSTSMKHWMVYKDTGSATKEPIYVSLVSHEECEYQKGRKCSIDDARKCHWYSNTHYYDEINCKCTCLVQVDGEETCRAYTLELC